VRQVLSKAKGIKISDNQQLAIIAYANDLLIITENLKSLKQYAKELIMVGKEIGLNVNEEKTKYLILSRKHDIARKLEIEGYSFKSVENFKYLGASANENANTHEEIRERLITGNRRYFGLSTLFKSKLLSSRSEITLYKDLIRTHSINACKTWAITKTDENKLGVFERKILRKMYRPKKNEVGHFEVRINEELRKLFGEPNIIGIMKSGTIRWVGYVWRSEGELGYTS